MITHSETITKLAKAMLAVQGSVEGVAKDSANPHFRSRYASLEAVVDAIRPHCQKAGLVVTQALGEFANGAVSLETMLIHAESGEWLRSIASAPVVKTDPQGVGSAMTYLSRYGLMAAFNLPPVDDDGNSASARPAPSQPAQRASEQVFPNAADRLADGLITTLNSAQNAADLDDIKRDPEFIEKWKRLSPENKARVEEAGRRVAATFSPPMAG